MADSGETVRETFIRQNRFHLQERWLNELPQTDDLAVLQKSAISLDRLQSQIEAERSKRGGKRPFLSPPAGVSAATTVGPSGSVPADALTVPAVASTDSTAMPTPATPVPPRPLTQQEVDDDRRSLERWLDREKNCRAKRTR